MKMASDEPFLLHNVDVISDIDLARMVDFHRSQRGAGDAGSAGAEEFAATAV